MIPLQKVKDIIIKYDNLEKELSSGSVDGSITGTSVSIDGKANGVISAADLSVASSGTVMADVTYETLSTDKGAKLQGNLKVK